MLYRFSSGELLTVDKLNAIVDSVNDLQKRVASQKIREGTGYTFTESQGGTSLQIIQRAADESGGTDYVAPFKVSAEENASGGVRISTAAGTLFGCDSTASDFYQIGKQTIDVAIPQGETWIVCAKLKCAPTALPTPYYKTEGAYYPDYDSSVYSIPFSAAFLEMTAENYANWLANARYDLGQEKADGAEANVEDHYGIAGPWNVYFPIALIKVTKDGIAVEQILHSDIFWYGHWTKSI